MAVSLKPINEQVVIITGGSSGIGMATAQLAAKQGATVVIAARSEEDLRTVTQDITDAGGTASYVVADVGKREDIERIAQTTLERHGRFDTWVNDAGVFIYGRLEEVSETDSRQLFDTNFWGLVNGSLVASAYLKEPGHGGAIINLGSEASDVALPLQGMYAASKHAIKGFTDTLRMELEQEKAPISVTLIKPAAINTPYPQHAKNDTGHEPKLPPPVYAPEEVASAIVHAAAHPQRDIYVGAGSKLSSVFGENFPRALDKVSERLFFGLQQRDEPPRNPDGTLWRGGQGGRVSGDHPGVVQPVSIYTRLALHPVWGKAALAAVGTAAWFGLRRLARR